MDVGHEHSHHHAHSHSHSHSRAHSHKPEDFNRIFIFSIVINFIFVIVEFTFGKLSNSLALISDAGHNLSDVLGLGLAFMANLLMQKKSSQKFTYGFRSTTILAALANALILLATTLGIIYHSFLRLQKPVIIDTDMMIAVSSIGIVINLIPALLFFKGRKKDLNIRGAFLHLLSDALVSACVVVSGLIIGRTQLYWLDSSLSLVVAFIILVSTWQLLRDALHLVLDAVPSGINIKEVENFFQGQKGVSMIHDLHIWSLSTTETALTCHLVMPDGHPGNEFLEEIGRQLQERFNIGHTTLQIENRPLIPCQKERCR